MAKSTEVNVGVRRVERLSTNLATYHTVQRVLERRARRNNRRQAPRGCDVSGAYALYEGAFGTAIVLELRANLVPHAHSETQIAFWLGGSPVEARIGNEIVRYGDDT